MLILDLWGISFHAVVVFGLGKNILSKSILARCALRLHFLWYKSLQKVDFFDHLPPPLVNVVCEWPLTLPIICSENKAKLKTL